MLRCASSVNEVDELQAISFITITSPITAPQKPDRIHLLAQIRRATIQDQRAVLEWLLSKFNIEVAEKK